MILRIWCEIHLCLTFCCCYFLQELSKIAMPVVFNEPLSFLQRISEYMEHTHLIRKACSLSDSIERMQVEITNSNVTYLLNFTVQHSTVALQQVGPGFKSTGRPRAFLCGVFMSPCVCVGPLWVHSGFSQITVQRHTR